MDGSISAPGELASLGSGRRHGMSATPSEPVSTSISMRSQSRFLLFLATLAALALPAIGTAQPVPGTTNRPLVDGIAAVVGNEVILVSDVLQQAQLLAQGNKTLNPKDPKVLQDVLGAIIDEKLVLTRAREDSINVSEDEVTRAVDFQIERLVKQVGSERRLEDAYGMSMDRIRRESRDIIRQQLLSEKMRQKKFADMKVTERDLNEFFQEYRDSLPPVPEQLELQRIVLRAKPSEEAKQHSLALARAIIDSIKAGGDFADFARRYSIDPGSAANGGELGYVKSGTFVKPYEDAMKKLGINEISDPVESQFGIHIIQVLDKRSDATRSRHILLPIQPSPAEKDTLVSRLNAIRARAVAGEDFSQLARQYSEEEETKAMGGTIGKAAPDQLPPDLKDAVGGLKDGEISEVRPWSESATDNGYQIIRVVRHIPAHKLDPKEDRAQLERLASYYKQNREYANWITDLRKEIYWDVKYDFK